MECFVCVHGVAFICFAPVLQNQPHCHISTCAISIMNTFRNVFKYWHCFIELKKQACEVNPKCWTKTNMEGSFLMGKRKYSYEQKLEVVKNVTKKKMSIGAAAKGLGCSHSSATTWVRLYQAHGADGLKIENYSYSGDFKVNAVEYMYKNHLSAAMAAPVLGIPKHTQLLKWERIYREEGAHALYEERRGRGVGDKKRGRPPKKLRENESLIEEVQRLRMENDYLKKLQALVQERTQRKNGEK